jgi:4-hydroxy-tetrahydrodipicolinate reductase
VTRGDLPGLAVFGGSGRMGRLVAEEAEGRFRITALYDRRPPGTPPGDALAEGTDVVVDFSLPEAWSDLAGLLAGTTAALVTGTTGLEELHMDMIRRWSRERAVFQSFNMSRGVYVLGRLLEAAGSMLGSSADLELVETHHRGKVDSPSGTALTLLDAWSRTAGEDGRVFGRHGAAGPRPEGEMGVHSVRGGDVPGDHRVMLLCQGEVLELAHRAVSRRTFALGALAAAELVRESPPGLYGMRELMASSPNGEEAR